MREVSWQGASRGYLRQKIYPRKGLTVNLSFSLFGEMTAVKRVLSIGSYDPDNHGGPHIVLAVAVHEHVNARAYFDWHFATAQKSSCAHVFGNGVNLKRGSFFVFPAQLHVEPCTHSSSRPPFGFLCGHCIGQPGPQLAAVNGFVEIVGCAKTLTEGLVSYILTADDEDRNVLGKAEGRKRLTQLKTIEPGH